MTFLNYEYFFLLLIIPLYFIKFKTTKEITFLFISFTFMVVSLARPVFYSNLISKDKLNLEFVLALDLSKSMLAQDIKPNRFEFSKEKVEDLISKLDNEKVSLLGFSNQPYMIIPSTNNYEVFTYLINNLSIDDINKNGTDYFEILKSTNEILKHKTRKFLILFTDGGDNSDFQKEIAFANENNIEVSVYNIGTNKGSPIRFNDELVKDLDGNIVVSKLNTSIKNLSDKTNGIYMEQSLIRDDLTRILDNISNRAIKDLKEDSLENKYEIFYIPLLISFIFFMLARFDGIKRLDWSLK